MATMCHCVCRLSSPVLAGEGSTPSKQEPSSYCLHVCQKSQTFSIPVSLSWNLRSMQMTLYHSGLTAWMSSVSAIVSCFLPLKMALWSTEHATSLVARLQGLTNLLNLFTNAYWVPLETYLDDHMESIGHFLTTRLVQDSKGLLFVAIAAIKLTHAVIIVH